MKIQYLQNARKRGMPVGQWNFVTVVGKTRMLEQEWKLLNPSLPRYLPDPPPCSSYSHSAGSFCCPAVSCQEQRLKISRRAISVRVDQLEAKPWSYLPAFLSSQEGSRRWGTEVRGQGSRSFFVLRKAELCGWRNCIGYRAESAGSEPLGDGFPLPL